ncbi:E3 ubiquitin-protein ligase TRIM39-like [Gastrophryne carolinensis]
MSSPMAYIAAGSLYPNIWKTFPHVESTQFNVHNNMNVQGRLHSGGNLEASQPIVTCTYCIYSAVPAIKTCLLCEASLCLSHLQVHSKSPEHVMTAPLSYLANLRNVKCSVHKEVMRYYCLEDCTAVCASCCLTGGHKGHRVELLEEVSEKKKNNLRNDLERLNAKQWEADRRVLSLQEQKKGLQEQVAVITERVGTLFSGIKSRLDDLENRVQTVICAEEERVSRPLTLPMQQLNRKQSEMSLHISETEKLLNSADPLTILTKMHENREEPWDLEENYDQENIDEGLIVFSLQRSLTEVMDMFRLAQGSSDLLLDVDTAANNMYVSGDRKTLSWTKINQRRLKNRSRFKSLQVVNTWAFPSGRHYWEVETSKSGEWLIGVCYPSTERKGTKSVFGNNKKSWCLSWKNGKLSAVHDQKVKPLLNLFTCQKIGIYLHFEAGRLSFYQVEEPIRHLHTFTTTFTEPLHAAFSAHRGWLRIKT